MKPIDKKLNPYIICKQKTEEQIMTKSQYATIPIELLEIDSKKKKITSSYTFHLFKITPYKSLKLNTIAVKIVDEKTPYIEEIITKNKIGLIKDDKYKVYLPGDIIYTLCSKEEAYLTAAEQLNYTKKISSIFTQNS